MKPVASLALGAIAVSLSGCQCRPGLPDPDTETTEETSKPDTAGSTGETGTPPVQGPCTLTEVEPNNSTVDAMPLPTDEYLCGGFGGAADFDYYAVELAEDAWLGVFVDAQIRGSLADVTVTVTDEGGFGVERQDDDSSRDSHLIFPAPPGSYDVWLFDKNLLGGEDFFYELVVSVAKAPILENTTELEPNDTSDTAMALTDGMVVLAGMKENNESDWFRVDVPAGNHAVTVDLVGYTAGSPGDYTIFYYAKGLEAAPNTIGSRPTGGRDPLLTFDSAGNTSVWFRVEEFNGKGGPGYWYALQVNVEAE